jgi:uncharacterized repeat protein (TIGR01451 family)
MNIQAKTKRSQLSQAGFRALYYVTISNRPAMFSLMVVLLFAGFFLFPGQPSAAVFGGYSEYYVPGPEDKVWEILNAVDNASAAAPNGYGDFLAADPSPEGLRSIISISASGDDTKIYYDHWENGYGLDTSDPDGTADEVFVLQAGDVLELEGISPWPNPGDEDPTAPVPVVNRALGSADPTYTGPFYYDGRDRFYVAGTSVAVSRSCWPSQGNVAATLALSWEVYPIKPFLTDYTIPVGEDLADPDPDMFPLDDASYYNDFHQTYLLVMSTEDNNQVQIDDPETAGVEVAQTLAQGETVTLHRIWAGTHITATKPVQVQFVVASERSSFEMRGYVAVPDNLWDNEYFSPVDGDGDGDGTGFDTDLYVYNPNQTVIVVQWEDLDSGGTRRTGTFTVQPRATLSYSDGTGHYVAGGAGVYLRSDDVFWAIGSGDTESSSKDWGFSLLPASFLNDQYYSGFAPGASDFDRSIPTNPSQNGSPVFVTAVGDETTVTVNFDYDGDGDVDADDSFVLNRLESEALFDTDDNDQTGISITASGPVAAVWGIDPNTSDVGTPYLDLGATILPFPEDWVDVTLGIDHVISPSVVGPQAGETSTVTLTVSSFDYPVNGVSVLDILPAGWEFVPDSAEIDLPGGVSNEITGALANPVEYTDANGLPALEWTNGILGGLNMGPGETLTIVFTIQTDSTIDADDIGQHPSTAQATGYRLEGTQVFTPFDTEFISVTAMTIDKDTTTPRVEAGGIATYTIRVDNITEVTIDQISVTDALPTGFTHVSGNATIDFYAAGSDPAVDPPTSTLTETNDGNWGGAWELDADEFLIVTFDADTNSVDANTYDNTAGADFQLNGSPYTINDLGNAGQDLGTPDGADPEADEDVTVYEYDLVINKKRGAAQNQTVSRGDTVTYTIYVENLGSSAADNVEIEDTLPDGFTFNTETSITPGGTGATRTATSAPSIGDSALSWGTWTLNAGGSIEIAFVVDVPPDAPPGTYDNTAIATVVDSPGGSTILYAVDDAGGVGGDSGTPASGGQQDTEDDEDITVGAPALTIDKDTTTPYAQPGSTVEYTIRVENVGTDGATGVSVTDTLPGGFTFASGSVSETNATRTSTSDPSAGQTSLTWGTWTIASGGSVEITFTVTVPVGTTATTYQNTASATADGGIAVDDDGGEAQDDDTPDFADPIDDEDVEVFAADTVADLSIQKSHTTDFEVGGTNQYAIVVTNHGPGAENGIITVSDNLPFGLTYAGSFTGSGWSTGNGSGDSSLTFTYTGGLAVGASTTLTLNINVDKDTAPASVTNAAAVSGSTTTDPVPGNNSDTDPTDINIPDLSTSTKTVQDLNGGTVEPGDVLQYIITLTETGGHDATGVSVTDDIPAHVAGFTVISKPAGATDNSLDAGVGNGSNDTGYLDITGITVAADDTATIIYQVTVATVAGGLTIVNNAAVTNPQGPGATPTADTLVVSAAQTPASGNKPIYLDDTDKLSRTPPALPQTFVGVTSGGSHTWTLDPATQLDLTIDGDVGTISVPLVLRSRNAAGTASHAVTVTLATTGDTVLAIGNVTRSVDLTRAESLEAFNVPVTGDNALTAGTRLTVTVAQTNGGSGNTMDVFPVRSGSDDRSRVELVSENVINVDSVAFYTEAYPTGSITDGVEPGTDVYVRSVVSDPFGSYDITSATLYVVDSEGAMVAGAEDMGEPVADSGAATKTFEFKLNVPDDGSDREYLTATVRALEGTEGTVIHTGAETIGVLAGVGADLSITKTHQGTFAVGQLETFTLTVTNNGPFAHKAGSTITVTDTIPADLTYASSTGTGWTTPNGPGDNPVTWTHTPATDVAPGASLPPITVTVAVDAAPALSVENEATVSGGVGTDDEPDGNAANNTARDTAYISQLGVTKVSDAESPYYDGDLGSSNEITYTVTVTNNGESQLTNVKVVDALTPALDPVSGSTLVTVPMPVFRLTEYHLDGATPTRDFSGTIFDLTLDHDLAPNYFAIIQGSAGNGAQNGNVGPASNYARLTRDPQGTGDLDPSGANNVIRLERKDNVNPWIGVVTVVECLADPNTAGFRLRDVQVLTHGTNSISENAATDWDDIDQVLLMGGFNGAGCSSTSGTNTENNVCNTRLEPVAGTPDLVNSYRGPHNENADATVTVMVVEWGSEWTVQRKTVAGTLNSADPGGANTADQYLTELLDSPVARNKTWVWGTGFTDGANNNAVDGIGEAGEAVLVTLGDDLAFTDTDTGDVPAGDLYSPPDDNETQVAVGMELNLSVNFEVYVMTHPSLAVDYWFKTDGDEDQLTVNIDGVDTAGAERLATVTNGCNGGGGAWPRPIFSARYTDNDSIQLERRRWDQPFPAWIQGIDFTGISYMSTDPGNDPDELVAAADGYSLNPGDTMTVTYQAILVDATDPGPVTNTVYASSDDSPGLASDWVTLDVRIVPIVEFTDGDGNAQTSFDYTPSSVDDDIHLKVFDADRNVDPNTRESIEATVTNPDTGDSVTYTLYETGTDTGDFAYVHPWVSAPGESGSIEVDLPDPDNPGSTQTVTLTETGPGTGEFTNTDVFVRAMLLLTADGPADTGDNYLYVAPETSPPLQIDYGDPFGRSVPAGGFTDSGGDTKASYDYSGGETTVYPGYENPESNTDPGLIETVTVTVTNPDTGDDETVTLYETGADTGVFENDAGGNRYELPTTEDCSGGNNDGFLCVTAGSGWLSPEMTFSGKQPDAGAAVAAVATRAVIGAFEAVVRAGRVVVVWETVSESQTLGFYLERLNPATGVFERVGPGLVPGLITVPRGGIYQHVDDGAIPGETHTYRLVEIEAPGRKLVMGPYTVTAAENAGYADLPGFEGEFYREAHPPVQFGSPRPMMMAAMGLAPLDGEAETGDVLKVAVSVDGLVYVSATTLESKFGRPEGEVAPLIGAGELSVTLAGDPVRYMAAENNAGIYFYGQAPESVYTAENIYLISEGSGVMLPLSPTAGDLDGDGTAGITDARAALQIMVGVRPPDLPEGHPVFRADIDGDGRIGPGEALYGLQSEAGLRGTGAAGLGKAAAGTGYFSHKAHFEEDFFPGIDYFYDPAEDYWPWAVVSSDQTGQWPLSVSLPFSVQHLAASDETAEIAVDCKSWNTTFLGGGHRVGIAVNGTDVGEGNWAGVSPHTVLVSFEKDLLKEGNNNLVTITNQAIGDISYVSVDGFDVTYPRAFKAVGNRLAFGPGDNAEVVVTGFEFADIAVFDVTDPDRPMQVGDIAVSGDDRNYQVRFAPVSPDNRYLALCLRDAHTPEDIDITPDTPSDLSDAANQGEYLIIAPAELADAVRELADYRQGQGMTVRVALLEDVMDEFNHGNFNPEAIRSFLAHARDAWAVPPRYVVLVGQGNYDYKDYMGMGGNLMPPEMVGTPYGLYGSDSHLADLEGSDGVPEVAIGRLPAADSNELRILIGKIVDYEAQAPAAWHQRIVMAAGADHPGDNEDFPAVSDAVAALVPGAYAVEKAYLPGATLADTRQRLLGGIAGGALVVNFLGHGGYDRMGDDGIMTLADVLTMDNGDRLPVVSAFSCLLGRLDELPVYLTLGERLVRQPGGGAVAVFASAAKSINYKARFLNEEFFRALFVDGKMILGDAVVQAFQRYRQRTGDSLVPRTYNLLGDPALRIHLDRGPS